MNTRPDMVEILKPGGGSKVYHEGKIHVRDDHVTVAQEDRNLKYPKHRVHRIVTIKGDEE